jgi:tetratricopeptide (TPR) repeat protein
MNNDMYDAIYYFNKAYYLSDEKNKKAELLLKSNECYKTLGLYEEAILSLKQIFPLGLSDTLQFNIKLQLAILNYLKSDFTESLSQLEQIEQYTKSENLKNEVLPIKVMVLNELENYDEAKKTMLKWIVNTAPKELNDSLTEVVNKLYSDKNIPHFKNTKTAKTLSYIFPGLGQLYAGYPLGFLASLTLTSAALGYGVYNFITQHYFTTFTFNNGLFQAFYIGGARRAEFLANKKNNKLKSNFNNSIKDYLK